MKTPIKYLVSLLVSLVAMTSFGATLSYTGLSTTSESATTNGVAVQSIIFNNPNSAAVTVALFDTASTNLTYTLGAYTNQVPSVGTTVLTWTNVLGRTESSTNTTVTYTPTLVAASTNNYPKIISYIVNTNSTVTFTPATPLFFNNGIAVTNSATNVTMTITYSRTR
jgi:hypothetical protein